MKHRSINAQVAILASCGLAASVFECRRNMLVNSPIFNEISGKLGGAVGMTSSAGMQLRGRVIPSNPRGTQQERIRAILASNAAYWRDTLTDAQRAAWTGLAGPKESGIDVFTAANAILLQGGGTRVSNAPGTRAGVFTPFTESADETPNVGEIAVTSTNTLVWNPANATDSYQAAAGGVINFSISPPQNSSRLARQFPVSWVGAKLRGGAATAGVQTITLPDNYPTLAVGDIVYARITSVGADGKVAPSQTIRLTAVLGS